MLGATVDNRLRKGKQRFPAAVDRDDLRIRVNVGKFEAPPNPSRYTTASALMSSIPAFVLRIPNLADVPGMVSMQSMTATMVMIVMDTARMLPALSVVLIMVFRAWVRRFVNRLHAMRRCE